MRTRVLSLLAVPMFFLAQCAPESCAPPPAYPPLVQGGFVSIGRMQTFGYAGHLGADWLGAGERQLGGGGYWGLRNWNTNGDVDGGGMPVEAAGTRTGRLEFYPDTIPGHWGSNDAWNTGVPGGLHLWLPDARALNGLQLPHPSNGAFHFVGSVSYAGRIVADGRLSVYAFQLINKDASAGAFNISTNRGVYWTAGYVWQGTYILHLSDTATGRSAKACINLNPGQPFGIDLAQSNFGLPGCPF